ncbi:MAG: hypothetical protein NPIRA05_08860 [Nitrospirales bacterium]|nr:MAG: hypothetical protein NPIRA05_08860 [Nitrospirales bacterium]
MVFKEFGLLPFRLATIILILLLMPSWVRPSTNCTADSAYDPSELLSRIKANATQAQSLEEKLQKMKKDEESYLGTAGNLILSKIQLLNCTNKATSHPPLLLEATRISVLNNQGIAAEYLVSALGADAREKLQKELFLKIGKMNVRVYLALYKPSTLGSYIVDQAHLDQLRLTIRNLPNNSPIVFRHTELYVRSKLSYLQQTTQTLRNLLIMKAELKVREKDDADFIEEILRRLEGDSETHVRGAEYRADLAGLKGKVQIQQKFLSDMIKNLTVTFDQNKKDILESLRTFLAGQIKTHPEIHEMKVLSAYIALTELRGSKFRDLLVDSVNILRIAGSPMELKMTIADLANFADLTLTLLRDMVQAVETFNVDVEESGLRVLQMMQEKVMESPLPNTLLTELFFDVEKWVSTKMGAERSTLTALKKIEKETILTFISETNSALNEVKKQKAILEIKRLL